MKRGYLYIAVTTLLFSSMEVALKLFSGQFNPIQLNFSRFLVGGLVLIPFAVRELKKRGITALKVVYSEEEPLVPAQLETSAKRQTPGSVSFVPPVVGMILASVVIKGLI